MNINSILDLAVSAAATDTYLPAAEKILAGHPQQSVRNDYASPCGQFNVGIWSGEPGQWTISYTEHEYCEILQGISVIRDQDGNSRTVKCGDRFVIPAGFSGTWEVLESCRKVYVVFEATGPS